MLCLIVPRIEMKGRLTAEGCQECLVDTSVHFRWLLNGL